MLKLPDYVEINLLYTGTRTIVYRAIRATDGQPVIIKVLRNPHPSFKELVQFRNQYVITSHLEHPRIVRSIALERHGNGYALVMPDSGAIALTNYWQQSQRNLTEFLALAIQLAEALHYLAGQRIVHKDIKPANIIIHPETGQVQLIDFSISSLLPREQQQLINPNVLEGTLAYISPEQTGRMNRGIDYRTDFYSVGVTFFQLLTGKLPFETSDPMELVHCHIAKTPTLEFKERGHLEQIPQVLGDMVFKLMAKNAEDRYQSALGLKHDLERCQQELSATGVITTFEVGERDLCDRFIIPEKLYGREKEVQALLDAFERVANPPLPALGKGGLAEMMLVAGFSGIGKTAVVNEVHKPIVRQRGYFIKGKFDQFNRNIPFSAFVKAFRDLMEQLLSSSDAELEKWKARILEAVGDNGQVLIDVIPELEGIIGQQPAVPELSGSAAQNRFNLLFPKFIAVFTSPEHPLVMFLDDLQWVDSASLNLIQVLMGSNDIGNLLLLGAYRDNEVFPAHPLVLTLNELEKEQAPISTITLPPLAIHHINRLVAETLSCSVERAQPLTELVYQKTQGNPFFTTQFLKGLHQDELIAFNRSLGYWQCDMVLVRSAALTSDVVEFMVGRLQKLPKETQKVMNLAACIGNQFDLETLAVVCESKSEEVALQMWGALKSGLILPMTQAYKFFQGDVQESLVRMVTAKYRFLHDRVQQAAYSLIPEEQKALVHYHIGQLLLKQIPPEAQENRIFELVSQLNYGTGLIIEPSEREELARLNLIAGNKARAATAYQAGREYASTGLFLLGENAWIGHYEMSLAFHQLGAELASLCGDFQSMEQFIEIGISQAHLLSEKVIFYRLRILAKVSQNQLAEAMTIGRAILQELGIEFPDQPTFTDIEREFQEIRQLIGERQIEDLVNLPAIDNGEKIGMIQIATSLIPVAFVSGSPILPLLISLPVKISIQHGNIPASVSAYVHYGIILCNVLKDIETAIKFGQLAIKVASRPKAKAFKPEALSVTGLFILHRKSHLKETLPLFQEGYASALEVGNLQFAGYTAHKFCLNSFWCGQNLASLAQDNRTYYYGLVQLNQFTPANWCRIYWQPVLNLLESPDSPTVFDGEAIQENEFLPKLLSAHDLWGLYYFYLYKLMLCFLFEEIELAQEYALEVKGYLMAGAGTIGEPAFYFYDSLTILSNLPDGSETTLEVLDRVEQNQTQLQQYWAHYAPMNHQHKVDIVAAEKCRVFGQKIEALELYDRAIASAKEHGYIQEEALANELAAKFYLAWEKEKFAALYMQEAYYCYARWGAKAKTDQLETKYPQLLAPILEKRFEVSSFKELDILSQTVSSSQHTNSSSEISQTLDFVALLKADRVLSSTLELNRLLDEISRIILINAGAQKAVLLVPQDDQWELRAIAYLTSDGTVETNTTPQPLTADSPVPIRLIHYVKNTQKPVLINEGQTEISGILEGYLLKYQPQSVLCFPLLNQDELEAIVYLEHPTTKGIFTPHRQTLVQFICTEAAIALKNAHLYQQAQQALLDLQQAQLQLVQSEKMSALGNLMAGVAHEINNPTGFLKGNIQPAQEYLQDLLGLIDLYQEQFPNPGEAIESEIEAIELEFIRSDFPELLESMNQGVDQIKNISISLRTFARKDEETKVAFKLHEGIDSTLLILKHRTKANEHRPAIKIVKKYQDIPEVQCFPGQLNQVFMNILANAIDAFDEANEGKTYSVIQENPNQINISISQIDETRVQIQLEDNGCGMKPETKGRIFEQGFTTKGVGKGTGLGMAIAHQIVAEKHGGTITCDSELGKGTTFAVVLPI